MVNDANVSLGEIENLTGFLAGIVEYTSDRLAEGAARLETATRIDPDLTEAWINLGVARRRLGDLPGARAAYRRAGEEVSEAVPPREPSRTGATAPESSPHP